MTISASTAEPTAWRERKIIFMFLQRLLTGLILAALAFGIALAGPSWMWASFAGIGTVIGAYEWARLCKCGDIATRLYTAATAVILFIGFFSLVPTAPYWLRGLSQAWLILALIFWLALAPMWLYFQWRPRQRWLMLAVGAVVLVPAWSAAVLLQMSAPAFLFAIGVVIVADTAAYSAGRTFGRRKLAPAISPGKTWEGVIGAYVGVIVLALATHWLVDRGPVLAQVLFACVLATLSIEGDLFESWIKRMAGVKDSGNILPGHGGVLDRLDGLSASLPLAALYLMRTSS
jgi:phosphatidate cytidylyltransferase